MKRWITLSALIALLAGAGLAIAQLPNNLNISSAASGSAPAIRAGGIDANISINLVPKGSGTVQVNGTPIVVGGGTTTSLTINPGPLNVTGPLFIQPGTAAANKRVGATIAHNVADVTTTGTLIETLYTFPIAANTLAADGESLQLDVVLSSAANANNKTVTITYGATNIGVQGPVAANAENFVMRCQIFRTGAATQKAICWGVHHAQAGVGGAALFGITQVTTPAETLSGAVNLLVRGTTPTAAGDLTARFAKVFWQPVGQ
jgi:hypothetical protein